MSAVAEGALVSVVAGDPADPGVRQRAGAWLTRVFEPGDQALVRWVGDTGPVAAVRSLLAGTAPARFVTQAAARGEDRSLADLLTAARLGARLVVPGDDEWPTRALHCLAVAADRQARGTDRTVALVPPLGLWVRGRPRLDELVDRSVAVVGSRASTAYGNHVAGELAAGLWSRGWTTVSGAATGIDAAAHRGAVAAGGATVAVLACGVDRAYPAGHAALLERVLDDGLVVSEWPPGSAPLGHRFLVRNRLIAALSRGTVVVEAAARSGSLATANRARELGRPVMGVPGPVTSALSVGVHQLLRGDEPARLVSSAAEVLEEVGRIGADLAAAPARSPSPRDELTDVARRVLDACPVRIGVPPERLAAVAGCAELDVLRVLPVLELHGLVERVAGGWRVTRDRG
ncbi:DNA-processing protein DprA [Klenkia brasiliensis]|uniref:DNA processing protein n=1 Tax=Klenkia brasiliensis TaxID=333142 RepID=A0A1G7WVV9_9ACTN|nr:DNA-processing protein DprA [Klenkia brasiliensis]SDG76088.1 DNA processing protein [Klenkia brasiliensis]